MKVVLHVFAEEGVRSHGTKPAGTRHLFSLAFFRMARRETGGEDLVFPPESQNGSQRPKCVQTLTDSQNCHVFSAILSELLDRTHICS